MCLLRWRLHGAQPVARTGPRPLPRLHVALEAGNCGLPEQPRRPAGCDRRGGARRPRAGRTARVRHRAGDRLALEALHLPLRDDQRQALERERQTVQAECERLAEAAGMGGPMAALVARLQARQAHLAELDAALLRRGGRAPPGGDARGMGTAPARQTGRREPVAAVGSGRGAEPPADAAGRPAPLHAGRRRTTSRLPLRGRHRARPIGVRNRGFANWSGVPNGNGLHATVSGPLDRRLTGTGGRRRRGGCGAND
ncbi:hypothetical protein LuPra_03958 [Luteitalea pratensis]|uniref:Uncharacterized protein n=1 Tax=Luteitalea pratensis TaxID=1855912 RepID=A0A143PSA5_LUTPR|nr:hypothetical protein LuPra_03958 [Luteitalea pratensis]